MPMLVAEPDLFALYGTDETPEQAELLVAGELTTELRAGNLGKIRFGGIEVVRGIAFLARDSNWGTLPAMLETVSTEQSEGWFQVTYRARCQNQNASFGYSATIVGKRDGTLTFVVEGEADGPFETNRTGFVILHPLAGVAGRPVDVLHTDGSRETAILPAAITPTPPISDIETLRYSLVEGLTVSVRMTGDAYQMEDQRNWTDASFKTFFRPLFKPYPYTLRPGEAVCQSVEVKIDGRADEVPRHGMNPPSAFGKPMPAIGLAMDLDDVEAANRIRAAVADLKPQSLVIRLDPGTADVGAKLRAVAALAHDSSSDAVVELVVDGRLSESLADLQAAEVAIDRAGLSATAVVPCPRRDLHERAPGILKDGEAPLTEILAAARRYFREARVGGGALTYFAEFNSNPPRPDAVDFLTHGTSAIVHAASDEAVMETLESLPFIFHTARTRVPGRPYWLGPSSIGMRENPYGDATAPNPENRRIAGARRDPRHRALFGAAWTLGYWALAASHDIDHLTLAHAAGDFGVAEATPAGVVLFPLYHVLRGAARAAGLEKAAVEVVPGTAIVGWTPSAGRIEAWIANLTAEPVEVESAASARHMAVLDVTNVNEAARATDFMDRTTPVESSKPIRLGAYAIARFIA